MVGDQKQFNYAVAQEEDIEKRVTIWNWREQRKLSGNAAPFRRNLQEYLQKHPDWEEYKGQDKDINGRRVVKRRMPMAPVDQSHARNRANSFPMDPMDTASMRTVSGEQRDLWSSLLLVVNEAAGADFGMDLDEDMDIEDHHVVNSFGPG